MSAHLKDEVSTCKRITHKPTLTYNGTTYQINNAGNKKLPLFAADLKSMINQFEICHKKFGRLLMVRVDLHTPIFALNNDYMSRFMNRLIKALKYKYQLNDVGYAWACEFHGDGKGQHYHLALFINGNVIRNTKLIRPLIDKLWRHPVEGYTAKFETECQHDNKKKRHFMLIDSGSAAKEAVYWLSYLAKRRGKLQRKKQVKDFSTSRIKYTTKT